ncbi:MAG: DNA-binding protein [Methylococcales bacterium]|nr:DNA-binding protein [Methylococcales bacterium]
MTKQSLVVADAGVLIHLDELDALDVLSDYTTIFVPDAVWTEVLYHRPQALQNQVVTLVHVPATPYLAKVNAIATLFTLHHGEREALSFCLTKNINTFLTDDTAARLAAKNLNIKARGTLGLLIRAVRHNLRSVAEILDLLVAIPEKSSLHVSPKLLDDVIEQLNAEWFDN